MWASSIYAAIWVIEWIENLFTKSKWEFSYILPTKKGSVDGVCGNARIRLPRDGGEVKKRLNGARRRWGKVRIFTMISHPPTLPTDTCVRFCRCQSHFSKLFTEPTLNVPIYSTCYVYLRKRSKSSDESDSAKTFSNIYSISPISSFPSFLLPCSVFAFISIILKSNANIFKEFWEFLPLARWILQFLMYFFRWVFAHSQFPLARSAHIDTHILSWTLQSDVHIETLSTISLNINLITRWDVFESPAE